MCTHVAPVYRTRFATAGFMWLITPSQLAHIATIRFDFAKPFPPSPFSSSRCCSGWVAFRDMLSEFIESNGGEHDEAYASGPFYAAEGM